ncbi:MAG: HDOD domain-containing protein [Phycisphaerae bacterium]
MGLWSWITGKRTQGSTALRACSCGESGGPKSADDGAVAVLEPPEAAVPAAQEDVVEKWWAPEGETLTEPLEVERPELTADARALENLLISHFDGHDLTLPPLLQVAERVLPRLGDPDCALATVANELAKDQVIAAAVLRMANSPLYRGLNKIAALQPAVSRLGTRAIRMLLMHESLRAAMFVCKGYGRELARMIWCRSLASACIMRGLSDFTKIDRENAFLIGLLHDIGDVVVLRIVHGEHVRPRYEIDGDSFEYLCYECHQEFGELVAEAWGLPTELKVIMADHHTYPPPDDPLRMQRLQLQLTNMINALLGYTPFAPYDLLASPVVHELGLADRDDFVAFLERLPDQVDETVGAL